MPIPVSNIAHVAVIAIALLAAPVDILAQDDHYESVQPDSADLLPLAATLVQSADSLAEIWPGFWSREQDFLLISPGGGILLITGGEPPPDYTHLHGDDVPPILTGRAFVRAGHLPGYGAGRFPGNYKIGDQTVYAVPTGLKGVPMYLRLRGVMSGGKARQSTLGVALPRSRPVRRRR